MEKIDTLDIIASLEGAAEALRCIANPLMEKDNHMSEDTIGVAVYGISLFLDAIARDVDRLNPEISNKQE